MKKESRQRKEPIIRKCANYGRKKKIYFYYLHMNNTRMREISGKKYRKLCKIVMPLNVPKDGKDYNVLQIQENGHKKKMR